MGCGSCCPTRGSAPGQPGLLYSGIHFLLHRLLHLRCLVLHALFHVHLGLHFLLQLRGLLLYHSTHIRFGQ